MIIHHIWYQYSNGNGNGNGNDLFYLLWLGSSILLSNHGGLFNLSEIYISLFLTQPWKSCIGYQLLEEDDLEYQLFLIMQIEVNDL